MPVQEINEIKDRFVRQLSPKSIYLFGSYAKGTQNEDSDFDFYIIMPDNVGNQLELTQRAYRSLRGMKRRPVDILLDFDSSFRKRSAENTLERIVAREGILLYGEQSYGQ